MAASSGTTARGEPLQAPRPGHTAAAAAAAASDSENQSEQNTSIAKGEVTEVGPKDLESQAVSPETRGPKGVSAFKSLGWLDRFLAVWIFLAMAIGIILGNFVPETGPALEKGKLVGVSVPIGTCLPLDMQRRHQC